MIERIYKNPKSTIAGILILAALVYLGIKLDAEYITIIIGSILFLSFIFAKDDYFLKLLETIKDIINKR